MVIVPSWSVRLTFGGEPLARRPDDLDAMSWVAALVVARSKSGERRLRPPFGRSRYVHGPRILEAAMVWASRSRSLESQQMRPSGGTTRTARSAAPTWSPGE